MQPINYMLDVQSPIQTALAGYMQGKQFRAQEQGMEMQRQQFDMQRQQFEAAQAQIAQQQARAQEVQGMMAQFAERFASGDPPTAQEFAQLQVLVPEMTESIQNAWATLSEQQKEGKIQDHARAAIALVTDPSSAMKMFDERILAAENAGDTALVAQLKASKAQAEMYPESVLTAITSELAFIMDPERFDNFMSRLVPTPEEVPDSFRTLHLRALAAGYEPGTPEYERFMLNAGPEPQADQGFGISFDENGNIIYVGSGAAGAAKVPPGYMRALDPTSPTGTRLVFEPGGPASIEAEGKARSRSALESTFESMFIGYKDLQTSGAIRDVEKGAVANVKAYLQTSPLGREIGKATGSKAEATREAIEALQPSISQAIMAQPGMSARGMDSVKELEFFIKSITAPKTEVNTNYATLHALDMRFGSGQLLNKMLAQDVITQDEYNQITRSKRVASVLGQLDEKVDELFTMDEAAATAPAVPSRLQQYFGGD